MQASCELDPPASWFQARDDEHDRDDLMDLLEQVCLRRSAPACTRVRELAGHMQPTLPSLRCN